MTKPIASERKFSFNIPSVDSLFPGFRYGDFAVIYGSPVINSLSSLLCVRAQIPEQIGGLGSNVVFIDCGKTFDPNEITKIAKLNHIDPIMARQRVFNFKAFSAYQLTTLIMDKLEEKIKRCSSKIVIISDIANLFLDNKISKEEIQRVYGQIINYLSHLAKKLQIIIIAVYMPHEGSIRNIILREMTLSKADTVISYFKTIYTAELNLEKHPIYMSGTAEPPSENMLLTSFM